MVLIPPRGVFVSAAEAANLRKNTPQASFQA